MNNDFVAVPTASVATATAALPNPTGDTRHIQMTYDAPVPGSQSNQGFSAIYLPQNPQTYAFSYTLWDIFCQLVPNGWNAQAIRVVNNCWMNTPASANEPGNFIQFYKPTALVNDPTPWFLNNFQWKASLENGQLFFRITNNYAIGDTSATYNNPPLVYFEGSVPYTGPAQYTISVNFVNNYTESNQLPSPCLNSIILDTTPINGMGSTPATFTSSGYLQWSNGNNTLCDVRDFKRLMVTVNSQNTGSGFGGFSNGTITNLTIVPIAYAFNNPQNPDWVDPTGYSDAAKYFFPNTLPLFPLPPVVFNGSEFITDPDNSEAWGSKLIETCGAALIGLTFTGYANSDTGASIYPSLYITPSPV